MFLLHVTKNRIDLLEREMITSGSVNVYRARFEFSPDWEGMTRRAVFTGSGQEKAVLLDGSGECDIPWETVTKHGGYLLAGVFGAKGDCALPTIRVSLGKILQGVTDGGDVSRPPAPDIWAQELEKKQDKLTGLPGQVVGFDENGNAAAQDFAGGGGESAQGPPGPGKTYQFGHGLKETDGTVSVDMASDENPDRTLPVSAAAVDTAVGNIEVLLKIIRGV